MEQSLNCVIEHTHLIADNSLVLHSNISPILFTKAMLCLSSLQTRYTLIYLNITVSFIPSIIRILLHMTC